MSELAAAARDLLRDRCTSARVRERAPFDEELWSVMVQQGWAGLLVPEDAGGLGLGPLELAALCHELGRALAPVPFVGSSLAAAATRDGVALQGIADGHPACVVFPGEQVVIDAVPNASVVLASDPRGVPFAGMVRPQSGLDLTRAIGVVDEVGGVPDMRVANLGRLALSAEAVGAAERALEMAVAYAKERVQFGKPIGSFQAVQHLLADMLRDVELARAATERAATALTDDDARAEEWCLTAKAKTGEACVHAVEIAIQVHGGIGYTWEHDIHLYYRRVRANAALLGDPTWCRAQLARTLFG